MNLAVISHCFPTQENLTAGNFLVPFLDEIQKQGHHVWVITPRMGAVIPCPYPAQTFPWRGGDRLLGQLRLWKPRDVYFLLKFLSEEKNTLLTMHETFHFDHALAVWLLPNALAARALKHKFGVPYSTWSLGSDINRFIHNPLSRMLLKNLLIDADFLFANSRHLCTQVNALSRRNPVFLPTYRPLEKPARAMIPRLRRGRIHFLCVARLEKVKGVDILIDAFGDLVKTAGTGISLHILGDGSQRRVLEKTVREHNLGDTITFYGAVQPITVAAFLSAVDCLVLPSRSEGMPIAFWEAQGAGIPVIGTDVGDLGWAINTFGQGIVVPPENRHALQAAMQELLRRGKQVLRKTHHARPPHPRQIAQTFIQTVT
ncbi:MAG: glycosyltransferase [candidate division WOR-3 bacterium]|nr:MAG: glycosyltransferase [candidate division WOR-3 bacterium]